MIAGKSSALVRKKLRDEIRNERGKKMGANTYIIFIDDIAPEKFIIGNKRLDKLLRPTRFTIANLNKIDMDQDTQTFKSILETIQRLLQIKTP